MNFILKLISTAVAILAVCYLLPGVHLENPIYALVLALVLAFLNVFLKPILIILTLPITIVTLGLFLLVINALIILIADQILPGFHVDGFWWALLFSIVTSILVSILEGIRTKSDS